MAKKITNNSPPVHLLHWHGRIYGIAGLIILLAVKRLILAIKVHTQPKPQEPPEDFEYWPTWFAAFGFYHNRALGGLLILGLIIDALLRVFLPGFWPMS